MLRVRIKYKNDGYCAVFNNVVTITLADASTCTDDLVCIKSLKPHGDINSCYVSLSLCDITEVSFYGTVNDEMEASK